MKKRILLFFIIVASFFFGFAFNTLVSKQTNGQAKTKKVTGIGGIFFKCKDPKK